ncbi:MAG TPA: hypothetical protein VNW15_11160 [Rhizomicrobium sp.]|nr:hypothetical protein [Rhizomicrobium sp.]
MAPDAAERRLTARVFQAWSKSAGKSFPRRSQIDPTEFGLDWANCMMIDLDPVPANSRFSYVGRALRDLSWPTFERQPISECLEGSLLYLVAKAIPEIAQMKEPLSFSGAAFHQDADILYRVTLLPLSEQGTKIDGVLAAIGFREIGAEKNVGIAAESISKDGPQPHGFQT